MAPSLQPIRAVKCTYDNCFASFNTHKEMISHKKYFEEHDYCSRCDEDFDSYDDLAMHKAYRPDNHGMACRICGEEFKSKSGLRRHIELNHKVNQKLPCIGCGDEFYRASLLIEHIEFGNCRVIDKKDFESHIIHKFIVSELLKGGSALNRFQQKTSRFNAAIDEDDDGGVGINNLIDKDEDEETAHGINYKAIVPEIPPESLKFHPPPEPYPSLPVRSRKTSVASATSRLSSTLGNMSLGGDSEYETAPSTPGTPKSSSCQTKVRGNGKLASKELFKDAKPTPPPSEFSIEAHDGQMANKHGINIISTRFWDPISEDWNPECFLDTVTGKYSCPFTCELTFDLPVDLNNHIMHDHRITRMKCPSCLKYFKSCTALVSHCESRGSKCQINKADDFNLFLDRLTGGFLSVDEKTRPEFLQNETRFVPNPETGRLELWTPPTASYLQYSVSKPAAWKDPVKTVTVGGFPAPHTEPINRKNSLW
ncbi:hypothetical protein K504DRAFT_430576 [Pleomassaria siparia CBS 279.74]|uniref:C2H2-type domain-containing protein n=1 Tax=Pleomassaria siparia CBS 279.74 TaxID=1314801 RepID=A0A6G1KCL8_9PLEO|nr:hypothetical protein K504DRAFT_430576 [Pleomassaria siparia CBS 279.74]